MKLLDILKQDMAEGTRIHRKAWGRGRYIELRNNKSYISYTHNVTIDPYSLFGADDWNFTYPDSGGKDHSGESSHCAIS